MYVENNVTHNTPIQNVCETKFVQKNYVMS